MLRIKASNLTIESFAPDPSAANAGSFLQKRELARNTDDSSFLSGHVAIPFSLYLPSSFVAKLPRDVERATSHVARTPKRGGPEARMRPSGKSEGEWPHLRGDVVADCYKWILSGDRLLLKCTSRV